MLLTEELCDPVPLEVTDKLEIPDFVEDPVPDPEVLDVTVPEPV